MEASLKAPFNLVEQSTVTATNKGKRREYVCPSPPKPVKILETNSVYERDDPTRSHIDKAAKKKYEKKILPVRKYLSDLSKMANGYVRLQPPDPARALCTAKWLASWAEGDAFSELKTKQSMLGMGPILSAVALDYLQIREDYTIPGDMHDEIKSWLAKLARRQVAYFDANEEAPSSHANHRYWNGLGVAAAGIASDDTNLFEWGIESARIGIKQITPQGILPLELKRAGKARDYHLYAVAPLVMLAEMAERNGTYLYQEENGAIHRLVRTVLTSLTDPTLMESLTETKMNAFPEGVIASNRLAWLEIYNERFPDKNNESLLRGRRPLSSSVLGGNTTLLFRNR